MTLACSRPRTPRCTCYMYLWGPNFRLFRTTCDGFPSYEEILKMCTERHRHYFDASNVKKVIWYTVNNKRAFSLRFLSAQGVASNDLKWPWFVRNLKIYIVSITSVKMSIKSPQVKVLIWGVPPESSIKLWMQNLNYTKDNTWKKLICNFLTKDRLQACNIFDDTNSSVLKFSFSCDVYGPMY